MRDALPTGQLVYDLFKPQQQVSFLQFAIRDHEKFWLTDFSVKSVQFG
jgi:hypothetical protein